MIEPMTGVSNEVSATWDGLAQVPQLMNEVRAGALTLKSLIQTPQAAVSTGSPVASAAIIALGVELAIFLYETVQAIDDDIDGMRKVKENYERQEDEVVAETLLGQQWLEQLQKPVSPLIDGCFGGGR